jgi:predicted ATPase
MGARLQELRAATSFARRLARRGRGAEGRELLAPLYAAFTEGFGARDLVEAKALLDELG